MTSNLALILKQLLFCKIKCAPFVHQYLHLQTLHLQTVNVSMYIDAQLLYVRNLSGFEF